MKKLTLQEIKDTLVGCTILGTGGGGSLESGLEAVEKAWNAGHEFKLLSFDEINDDSYYANPYYCGSIVPKGDTQPETRRRDRHVGEGSGRVHGRSVRRPCFD